jgi:hypothetical protein
MLFNEFRRVLSGVIGFPQKVFGPALLSVGFSFLAVCTGVLYYLLEDWCLGIARPGSLRVTKWVFPMNTESTLTLSLFLWVPITFDIKKGVTASLEMVENCHSPNTGILLSFDLIG